MFRTQAHGPALQLTVIHQKDKPLSAIIADCTLGNHCLGITLIFAGYRSVTEKCHFHAHIRQDPGV